KHNDVCQPPSIAVHVSRATSSEDHFSLKKSVRAGSACITTLAGVVREVISHNLSSKFTYRTKTRI
ncbi:hypothetical protein, partial [Rhodopseudomonas sp. BR0C11]|uniref:hypothetical protein n=1 Tax=Rhodopseudomonas sp. BR0C11 TaxID=2269370 RepID=UPI001968064B